LKCEQSRGIIERQAVKKVHLKEEIIMNKFVNAAGLVVFSALLAAAWLLLPVSQLQAKDSAASTFDAKCSMCHAKNGSGDSAMGKSMKVPDLRSKAVQSQSNADLYNVIAKGKGIMPQYGNQLSKEEINGMVAYIRHLGGRK
jgi:mono/diheme cytochrome c family protein